MIIIHRTNHSTIELGECRDSEGMDGNIHENGQRGDRDQKEEDDNWGGRCRPATMLSLARGLLVMPTTAGVYVRYVFAEESA